MLAEVERVTKRQLPPIEHLALKEWRFSNYQHRPLIGHDEHTCGWTEGEYLVDDQQQLAAVGDWGLGRAEAARMSGVLR
jgi:hypothetical protein